MAKVSVVVLGDVGHSPRMQYHALSLANEGYNVTLIGYNESRPMDSLTAHRNIYLLNLLKCPEFKKFLPGIVAYVLKTAWQFITLFTALMIGGIPSYILVQNPPAIPSLAVCYIYSRITGAKFIIDWHNYAHTILALSLHEKHLLVRLCRSTEYWLGQKSDAGICVTQGMRDNLKEEHQITAVTLYDRPPKHFKSITVDEKHDFLLRIGKKYNIFVENCLEDETVFTRRENGKIVLRSDRPAFLISSTSWTEDEDFSILLEALQGYEETKNSGKSLPQLIVAITGKGPLKDFYTKIMEGRHWKHIKFITPWLEISEYPDFLACGDLGISLHVSSSQLDLPMKVVDMFGCGLPVAAVHFKCLPELVRHKRNGVIFENSQDLLQELQEWFSDFPHGLSSGWRSNIPEHMAQFQALRWHENWKNNALPLFQ